MRNNRVLILSHDKVGRTMAGPGIRYHYMAVELAKHFDVTLGVFNPENISEQPEGLPYRSIHVDIPQFHPAFDEADVIIAYWMSDEMMTYGRQNGKRLVFDIYAPAPVETLIGNIFSDAPAQASDEKRFDTYLRMYRQFLAYGDFFLFSSERQIDFWYGYIFASHLMTPVSYANNQLDRRLALAPMGIDLGSLPEPTHVLRERLGLAPDDFVVVWTGGIWDWFDAATVIRAMDRVRSDSAIKLVFLGTKHPNKEVPHMSEADTARKLSDELGLTDHSVFFLDGWLEYGARIGYLLDADAAIYAHKQSIETRFSYRTRVLDHILAKLPTIATDGDYFADVIKRDGLGVTVPVHDAGAMAEAFTQIKDVGNHSRFVKNLEAVRSSYSWTTTLQPLIEYIANDPLPLRPEPAMTPPESTTQSPKELIYRYGRKLPKPLRRAGKALYNRLFA